MRTVSKKRARALAAAKPVRDAYRASHPWCEARLAGCTGRTDDIHEVLSRARGGSLDDEANLLAVCRRDHDWITTHPKEATERGWLRSAIHVDEDA